MNRGSVAGGAVTPQVSQRRKDKEKGGRSTTGTTVSFRIKNQPITNRIKPHLGWSEALLQAAKVAPERGAATEATKAATEAAKVATEATKVADKAAETPVEEQEASAQEASAQEASVQEASVQKQEAPAQEAPAQEASVPDELKRIKGIGRVFEGRLNQAGIYVAL